MGICFNPGGMQKDGGFTVEVDGAGGLCRPARRVLLSLFVLNLTLLLESCASCCGAQPVGPANPHLPLISICLGLLSSRLGRRILRTPFSMWASTLPASTSAGIVKERLKAPK